VEGGLVEVVGVVGTGFYHFNDAIEVVGFVFPVEVGESGVDAREAEPEGEEAGEGEEGRELSRFHSSSSLVHTNLPASFSLKA
jgi:hypothetical protein